ncbi:MAG: tyrosine/phenylalanine carboxypeptidase domain-containing protein [Elusimicrobiota bacterium]
MDKKTDKQLKLLRQNLPFYSWLIPVNRSREREKFFDSPDYNPVYRYGLDVNVIKETEKKLREVKIPDSPFKQFYKREAAEIEMMVELLKNIGNSKQVSKISKKIYGCYTKADVDFADNILDSSVSEDFTESVSAGAIRESLIKEIRASNIEGWQIILKENIASKVTVKPLKKKIFIKKDYKFFPGEAERLKIHEIKVHLFRAENGFRQPAEIFNRGLAGYLEAEEGLAVFLENKMNSCPMRQMKIYAGRLKAVDLALQYSFRKTYEKLCNWFPSKMAYRLTERVSRGICNTREPGALTKAVHYITGYRKAKKILQKKNNLKILFTGKIGFEDLDAAGRLLREGILNFPEFLP